MIDVGTRNYALLAPIFYVRVMKTELEMVTVALDAMPRKVADKEVEPCLMECANRFGPGCR